jgi:putative SOS response-associated peptidase YedK
MCGRYVSARDRQQLMKMFSVDQLEADEPLRPDYNVAPTRKSPVVIAAPPPDAGKDAKDAEPVRQLRNFRWGLIPSWAKKGKFGSGLINARAETVHEKPSFRRAFVARRCLVPIDGFYEWFALEGQEGAKKPVKQPYLLRPADGGVLCLAGLYESWRDPDLPEDEGLMTRFTVITTTATDDVGHTHDRMPMVIAPGLWEAWLDPRLADVDEIRALMAPPPPGTLEIFPVSTAVNSIRNNGPHLIERAEPISLG